MTDRDTIEAIAEVTASRVVELLREGEAPFPREGLVEVDDVAGLLRVDRNWVYEHKTELGAIRLGDGPAGPLRFDAAQVLAYVRERRLRADDAEPPRSRPGPRRRGGGGFELLPLPDEAYGR